MNVQSRAGTHAFHVIAFIYACGAPLSATQERESAKHATFTCAKNNMYTKRGTKCSSLRVIIPAGCRLQAAGGAHIAERGQELLLFPACLIKQKSSNPFLQECKGRQRKQLWLKTEKKDKSGGCAGGRLWQSRSAGTCGLTADLSVQECYSLSQLPRKKAELQNVEKWISKLHEAHYRSAAGTRTTLQLQRISRFYIRRRSFSL